MTDIVERLRNYNGKPEWKGPEWSDCVELTCEAADEIEHHASELANKDAMIGGLQVNIADLEHMQANLHGHIKRLEEANQKLEQENSKLREALDWIADTPMQWTKPQNDIYWANMAMALAMKADDARAAL